MDFLQQEQLSLGVKEIDENKEDKGESSIETESAGRSNGIHETEEGGQVDFGDGNESITRQTPFILSHTES